MMHLMTLSYQEMRELLLRQVDRDLGKQFRGGSGKISMELNDDDLAFVTKYRANRPPPREIPWPQPALITLTCVEGSWWAWRKRGRYPLLIATANRRTRQHVVVPLSKLESLDCYLAISQIAGSIETPHRE